MAIVLPRLDAVFGKRRLLMRPLCFFGGLVHATLFLVLSGEPSFGKSINIDSIGHCRQRGGRAVECAPAPWAPRPTARVGVYYHSTCMFQITL